LLAIEVQTHNSVAIPYPISTHSLRIFTVSVLYIQFFNRKTNVLLQINFILLQNLPLHLLRSIQKDLDEILEWLWENCATCSNMTWCIFIFIFFWRMM